MPICPYRRTVQTLLTVCLSVGLPTEVPTFPNLLFFQSVWQRPSNKIKDVMMSYSSMGCHFWRAFPFQKSWYLFEEILTATPRPHGRLRGNRSLVVGGVPHRWDGTGNHHEATFGVGVVLRPDDVVECFLSTAIGGTSMNHSHAFEYDMTI